MERRKATRAIARNAAAITRRARLCTRRRRYRHWYAASATWRPTGELEVWRIEGVASVTETDSQRRVVAYLASATFPSPPAARIALREHLGAGAAELELCAIERFLVPQGPMRSRQLRVVVVR